MNDPSPELAEAIRLAGHGHHVSVDWSLIAIASALESIAGHFEREEQK